jgi:hypothetical protein
MQELELNPRDPNDRDLLISEWFRYAESGKADGSWAYDALARLIGEDPALAWAIILELVHRASPGDVFDLAAAGPPRRPRRLARAGGHRPHRAPSGRRRATAKGPIGALGWPVMYAENPQISGISVERDC